jgi:hypothetical protein
LITIWPEGDLAWGSALAPLRDGDMDREEFGPWWERNAVALAHLHPQIAEQWVHRHWSHSPYSCLPLEGLTWTLETWSVSSLLSAHMPRCQFDPSHDYATFNKYGGLPTARAMNATGTWDYPVILLHTPEGVMDLEGPLPDVRHVLIEGHCRMRYLNALVVRGRGEAAESHQVFVLSYEQ